MAFYLLSRDLVSDVKSAPDTFTSWDKCMQKAYCKWPAIVGIVIGSLIVLSLLWCFARCLCCGAECCACCLRCCPCGGRDRDRGARHKDDYSRMPPAPYAGYQPAPAPMAYGAMPAGGPQFATFDDPSGKKINEDSLPPMPSWDTAAKRRVEDTSDDAYQSRNGDLEMGRLENQPARMRGGYNSVPNGPPMSPHPQAEYPYNSDLGAQRMGAQDTGYDNFRAVPLSPPPTYRSTSNAASDRFLAGAVSPSPNDYNQQHQQPQSYAPSSVSTRYEAPTEYASSRISMPTPYNDQPQYQARPPSFLQVGRKPVNGSFREV